MTSLKEDVIKYLFDNDTWIHKGALCDDKEWTHVEKGVTKRYLGDTVARALRQAESESRIARRDDDNGVSIMYKFLPPPIRNKYIPWSNRKDKTILFKI
jgi:hypothetical protein